MITDGMPTPAPEAGGDATPNAALPYSLIAFASLLVLLGLSSLVVLVIIDIDESSGIMPRKWSLQNGKNQNTEDSSDQVMLFYELRSLRSRVFKDSTCPICIHDYLDNKNVKVMPCGHIFHPRCVDAWLSSKDSCPMCRGQTDWI